MKTDLNDFLPDRSAPEKKKEWPAYQLVQPSKIRKILKPRALFSHKGSYGHALIFAGAAQTMGAALLSGKGCLYGGAGLVTLCIPESGLTALNTCLPEAMYIDRKTVWKKETLEPYQAIAIGPGLSVVPDSLELLKNLFSLKKPLIIDADALNLLSAHPSLFADIPEGSLLTPHVKEFDRLFGSHRTWFERLITGIRKAKELKSLIILKNQYTFIISAEGKILINTTGCPAMAQGGMGDVLTGVLAAYIAQGFTAQDAVALACYFHGKAGDRLAEHAFNVTASQLAEDIPLAVKALIK